MAKLGSILALGLCTRTSAHQLSRGPVDCYQAEDDGHSYRGLRDFAKSGRKCVKWIEQEEVSTAKDDAGSHSYCRNPDQSSDSPWCFVHSPKGLVREECNVDVCAVDERDYKAEAEALDMYIGAHGCECGAALIELGNKGPNWVKGLVDSCLVEQKAAVGLSLSTQHRNCGLTQMVTKHCACAKHAGPMDCYHAEDDGHSYRGLRDFSRSGRKCVKWTEQTEVSTLKGDAGAHSFCRNPDQSSDSPWCFVHSPTGLVKEQCNVDVCETDERDYKAEAEALDMYMGAHDCECKGGALIELGKKGSLRGVGNSTHISDSFTNWVKGLVDSCLAEQKAVPGLALKSQHRNCGLTQVMTKHCKCVKRA